MNTDEAQRAAALVEPVAEREASGWTSSLYSNSFFLLAADLLLGGLAYAVAWFIRIYVPFPLTQDLLPQERWDVVNHFWGILLVSQGFFLYIFGMYDDLRVLRYREVLGHVLTAGFGQVVLITSVFYLTNGIFPRSVILVFGLVNVSLLSVWRVYVKSCLHADTLRVLVVAEDLAAGEEIAREIDRNPWMGLKIVGLVTAERDFGERAAVTGVPVLGTLEDTAGVITRHGIDEVIFASRHSWKDQVLNSLSRLQLARPLRIAIRPSVFEIAIGRLRHINIYDTPLIEVRRNPNEPLSRLVKRTFDLVIAAGCLVLLSPLILLIAAAIAMGSPGGVFYLQERVGRGGKTFQLIKFRTMIANAESASEEKLAAKDDPRVTGIGGLLRRFRLDEVPQFVNVLKGDMSFVGPRPERPGFVRHFSETLPGYDERHKVKPGMTGLAQVRGFYDTAADNKLRYDLAYIYNYSFSLDLLILLETIKVILIRRGS